MLYFRLPAADITLSLLLCRRGPPAVKNLAVNLKLSVPLLTGNADVAKPWRFHRQVRSRFRPPPSSLSHTWTARVTLTRIPVLMPRTWTASADLELVGSIQTASFSLLNVFLDPELVHASKNNRILYLKTVPMIEVSHSFVVGESPSEILEYMPREVETKKF